jgi:lipoprotein-anchoring transpeptidase ErfK/SrfK
VSVLEKPLRATYRGSGAELKRIQNRLLEIGFWLPTPNGKYGLTTRHAVLAFQKYHKLRRTGSVDPTTAKKLTEVTERVQARTEKGNAIEVDKTRQVLFLVYKGRTEWVFNTSTGSGQWFIEPNVKKPGQWEWGRSITPSGKFKIQYQRRDGWWEGDLGKIYRPKYFNGGIAIHGMHNVPAQPASHGCVRLGLKAMDYLWEQKWVKKGLRVWVYGEDTEARNKRVTTPPTSTTRPPTTSSSTTTTTTTTTTVAPVTP